MIWGRVIFGICGALAALFWIPFAQSMEFTPEQVQMLNQLTPEQRAAALKSLEGQASSGTQKPSAPEFPEVVKPRQPREQPSSIEARMPTSAPRRSVQDTPAAQRSFSSSRQPSTQHEVKPRSSTHPDKSGKSFAPNGQEDQGNQELPTEDESEGKEAVSLKQFGYDLFSGTPTTFAPVTDVPVPANYVIGPGDTIELQLFGQENSQYNLTVTRDGTLQFPGLGPVRVVGLTFDELKSNLERRIATQFIGVSANISMGALRSIRVFVLGDVERPGSYTVSSLSTMTNALFVSGGIKPIGSLRNIELKRRGQLVTRMDLYDLLLRGDTSADARLEPGDVIFVPSIGPTIGVAGEVKRPAIYELKGERSLKDALTLAGGLLPTAYPEGAQIERINGGRARTLVDVDLTKASALAQTVRGGDVLWIYSVLDRMDDVVLLSGHVQRPGGYQWHSGMRVTDLVGSPDVLLPKPDLDYALVRRETIPDRRAHVFSVDLRAAFADPSGAANVELKPRDELTVFSVTEARGDAIKKLLQELDVQATKSNPSPVVTVGGRVRFPGDYPLENGMRVADLVRAGGDLAEAAYGVQAEITRYQVINGEYRATQHLLVDLAKALAGDPAHNVALEPRDQLTIKETPQWSEQEYVELRGEVRFPGKYPISRGETLSHVLERAGGLSDFAYPNGAVFMREELRRKEQERFDEMAARLRSEIAMKMAQTSTAQGAAEQQQAVQLMQQVVAQLESIKAAGRLVIDLPALIQDKTGESDVVLKDGDLLVIPAAMQEVSVIGEVFHQTSHLYVPDKDVNNYVNRSGGTTRNADERHTYVIRANGAVLPVARTSWFRKVSSMHVQPGDTIVVPMNIDRIRPLQLWTSVSQIFYQLGVAIAAWNTVGVL